MEAARNVILLRKSADDNSQATYSSARETPSTHMFIRRPRRSYSASAAGSTATTSRAAHTDQPVSAVRSTPNGLVRNIIASAAAYQPSRSSGES